MKLLVLLVVVASVCLVSAQTPAPAVATPGNFVFNPSAAAPAAPAAPAAAEAVAAAAAAATSAPAPEAGAAPAFAADACLAMEVSSSSSPIAKLKDRVERSMVETSTDSTAAEASGPQWVQHFLGTNSLDDLSPAYGPKAKAFINAIKAAGGSVTIAATYRPMERSYMMYNAWRIAKGTIAAKSAPSYPGVNIDWTHGGNAAAARTAAEQMCRAYGINYASAKQQVAPAGNSRHNYRAAVDMNIQGYVGKSIANPHGAKVRVNSFSQLVALGAQYGVKYYSGENMHWSDTGR